MGTTAGSDVASGSVSTSPSLIERARQREPEAWAKLVGLYGPLVYRWSRRAGLQPSDAVDVVQEVFLAVSIHLVRFRRERPGDSFRGWLWTITQSKVVDRLRRSLGGRAAGGTDAHERLQTIPEAVSDEWTSAAELESAASVVRPALELVRTEFEERTWQAFWSAAVDEQAPADIAAALGMSVAAVYKAKSRVLARLRSVLA